jgi:hypothetical protein
MLVKTCNLITPVQVDGCDWFGDVNCAHHAHVQSDGQFAVVANRIGAASNKSALSRSLFIKLT